MQVTYAVLFLSSCLTGVRSLATRCAKIHSSDLTPQMGKSNMTPVLLYGPYKVPGTEEKFWGVKCGLRGLTAICEPVV
jgi:hypothetical protein